MPTQSVDGRQLFFARHRTDNQQHPDLILIHGAGSSHVDWPAELRQLPRTTVIIPDLPGHGRSGGDPLASIEAYAGIIAQWIDSLALDNVVLLGHSMGGAIVLTLALHRLPGIRGIVLLATGARLRVSDAILDGIWEDFPAAVDELLTAYWGSDASADVLKLSRERLMEVGPGVLYADFQATDSFDVMNDLRDIEIPALVVAGEQDVLTPPKYARYLAEHIPDAELLVVPDTHHMLHLQQPDRVAQAVERFLDRLA